MRTELNLTLSVDDMEIFIHAIESNIKTLNEQSIAAHMEYNEDVADEDELREIKETDAEVIRLINLLSASKHQFAEQGFLFKSVLFYIPQEGRMREPEGFVKVREISA